MGEFKRDRKDWSGMLYILTVVGFLAFAIVNLLMYPHEGKVTINLGFEGNTDYRLYQYVAGKVKDVEVNGESKAVKIEKKKLKDGTLVMLNASKNIKDSTFTEIEITYDTSEAKLNKKYSKTSDLARTWIEEYSYIPSMDYDLPLGFSGKDRKPDLLDYGSIYYTNVINIMFVVMVIAFACILIVVRKEKIKVKESTVYLLDYIKDWKSEDWYNEKNVDAEMKFKKYIMKHRISLWLLITALFVVTSFYFFIFGREDMNLEIYLFLIFGSLVLLMATKMIYDIVAYRNLQSILTEECDPYQSILAYSKIYEYSRGRDLRTNYAYNIVNAISLFWIGNFEEALILGEKVWNESNTKTKNSIYYVHYHSLRHSCFCEIGDFENSAKESLLIEEYIINHTRNRKHKLIKSVIEGIDRACLIENKEWDKARIVYEQYLNTQKLTMCQKVTAHYRLSKIYIQLENNNQATAHADFVKENGTQLFMASKLNPSFL